MSDFGQTFGYFDSTGKIPPGGEAKADDIRAWITTTFTIGCFFGAMFASRLADLLSRRYSILVSGTLFVAGGIIQSLSSSYAAIVVGRTISGLSIGVASMTVPLYISEISTSNIRGAMITVYQLMITIGIFVATCVNSLIILSYKNTSTEWRLALGIQTVPGFILTLLVAVMPFSPRWLMMRGRDEEAMKVLTRLNPKDPEFVQHEFDHIKEAYLLEKKIGEGTWAETFAKGVRNRVLIGFILQFFQQWTGINIILYYGSTIFAGVGFSADQTSIGLPLANTAINIIGTLPGMYLIDRVGRKKLLVYGGIIMGISHFLVCVFYGLADPESPTRNPSMGWGAIIFVYFFILGFSSTWGPIAWVYQSEIFPLRVRARGTGIATMSNWFWNGVVGNTALRFFNKDALGFKAYIIYGAACIVMALYCQFFVPETMGKSLEDMDEIFGKPEGLKDNEDVEVAIAKE